MKFESYSPGRKLFIAVNYVIITLITVTCVLPILNLLAKSFSSSTAIISNKVTVFPVDFTLEAYEYVLNNLKFWNSLKVSFKRVLLGVPLEVLMTILVAYPLSKADHIFPARKFYVGLFLTTMLISGGMMPTYFIVAKTGLLDTVWSLILPGVVPVYSCIVLMNFFRGIPVALEESATLDGANQFQTMALIYLPLSKPSLATVTLFSLVGHWNSWFDGLLYSNFDKNYPLQSYLQTLVVSTFDSLKNADLKTLMDLARVNNANMKAAQIFISLIPLMMVYPLLQKYFTTGLTLGSVKG